MSAGTVALAPHASGLSYPFFPSTWAASLAWRGPCVGLRRTGAPCRDRAKIAAARRQSSDRQNSSARLLAVARATPVRRRQAASPPTGDGLFLDDGRIIVSEFHIGAFSGRNGVARYSSEDYRLRGKVPYRSKGRSGFCLHSGAAELSFGEGAISGWSGRTLPFFTAMARLRSRSLSATTESL